MVNKAENLVFLSHYSMESNQGDESGPRVCGSVQEATKGRIPSAHIACIHGKIGQSFDLCKKHQGEQVGELSAVHHQKDLGEGPKDKGSTGFNLPLNFKDPTNGNGIWFARGGVRYHVAAISEMNATPDKRVIRVQTVLQEVLNGETKKQKEEMYVSLTLTQYEHGLLTSTFNTQGWTVITGKDFQIKGDSFPRHNVFLVKNNTDTTFKKTVLVPIYDDNGSLVLSRRRECRKGRIAFTIFAIIAALALIAGIIYAKTKN